MEVEEGSRKRQWTESECECDVVNPFASKKTTTPAKNEVEEKVEQDVMAWLTLDDDTVSELLDSLEAAPSSFSSPQQLNFKVKFIEDPYMAPVIFQSSSAYVTINVNEESCGSSFSDSDSTVMASVDMGSVRGALARELNVDNDGGGGGAWVSDAAADAEELVVERGWVEEGAYVEGIFVKSLSSCSDLFGTPPRSSSGCYNYENENGDGDEMWVNFLGEDLFDGA
ncbi:hypothetical protein ACH5RR_004078 [Cinchona calisaya]|uniref:Uncharacterized protein n=1 Tax=Cinchona calisaya TaxID=153742 RepID=A0ABD3AXE3_9GENT